MFILNLNNNYLKRLLTPTFFFFFGRLVEFMGLLGNCFHWDSSLEGPHLFPDFPLHEIPCPSADVRINALGTAALLGIHIFPWRILMSASYEGKQLNPPGATDDYPSIRRQCSVCRDYILFKAHQFIYF